MKKNSYRLTVHTDEQMFLMQKISECYLRERMGQFWDLAEDLASEGSGYSYDNDDPDHEEKFSAYIHRRDEAEKTFNKAFAATNASRMRQGTANIAGDFFTTIRYAMWLERPEPKPHGTVDSNPCYRWSEEQEPPKCYKGNGEDGSEAWLMEMDRTQLVLLQNMAETFMRERAGQFWLLTDSLAYEGLDYNSKGPDFEDRHRECAENAGKAQELFEAGYRASGAADYPQKTKRMMMAYDIYSVIRHALWLENPDPNNHLASGKPLHECAEVPLIEIERKQDVR